ncbi:hypothetical protein [Micromonospora taraxaci]
MTMTALWRRRQRLTPADCLRTLPDPTFDIAALTPGDELRGAELRRSVLTIAQLDHVSETAQVREVVVRVRGAVPPVGD